MHLHGEVGETVKYGWERYARRGTVGPTQERDGRPIATYHHLSTLGEMRPFLEIEMAKGNLSSMSVDELLKLREDIGNVLGSKANAPTHCRHRSNLWRAAKFGELASPGTGLPI